MTYKRFFRILATATILSLLMLAIPAVPALAAEELEVNPEKAEIGDYVDIEGSDFTPATVAYIYFSSQVAEVGDEIDDEVTIYEKVKTAVVQGLTDLDPGTFDYIDAFAIPSELTDGTGADEEVHGGDYYFYATYSGDDRIETIAEFTVIGIKQLDPGAGPVGTEVEIEGVGFDRDEDITVYYDGVEETIVDGDEDTDSGGEFRCEIEVPESTAGAHTITVEDESGHEGAATFTVEPTMTLSSTAGAIAAEITINGAGFGESVDITITFDGDEVDIVSGDDNTDVNGSFEAVFAVPELGPGTYVVEVEDDDDNTVAAEFTITTDLTVTPLYTATSPGHVGAQIEISGVGFKANSTITITYASDEFVFTTTSLADGSFSYLLTIPPSQAGQHIITVTDGIIPTPMQATFYMESMPPLIPQPRLPLLDSKLEDGKFDWDDVADLSLPVTYDLQIATDASFTSTSILVEQTELTSSEYTLTEEEELESTSEEEPYYWRVRAVDAASNVSGWSGAGTFYVGFSFEIKGWLLYTLIGIGAVFFFFLGFWIGRRTIPEYY